LEAGRLSELGLEAAAPRIGSRQSLTSVAPFVAALSDSVNASNQLSTQHLSISSARASRASFFDGHAPRRNPSQPSASRFDGHDVPERPALVPPKALTTVTGSVTINPIHDPIAA
jgi:hypothetical protein